MAAALLSLGAATSDAALLGRSPAMDGGIDYQAYFDTDLNITWLGNANAAAGSIFDDGVSSTDGKMTWDSARAWIASLNTSSYLGVNDWRLPIIIDTGTPGCNFGVIGTDCGYNVDLATGELAHLFYGSLGNGGAYNSSGVQQSCIIAGPNYCLTRTGPFSNVQNSNYWSGTGYAPSPVNAWDFVPASGIQFYDAKNGAGFVWAVRYGDIGLVPVPGAAFQFLSALLALGWARRQSNPGFL
jgi:hypothetical protein